MRFAGPQPRKACFSVWALPPSLAATEGIVITFSSSGYLDVSVHRVPRIRLWIHLMLTYLPYAVFPHSDIHGSKPACGSPWLFAACHVLHRRLVPGHPPYALVRLISFLILRPFGSLSLPVLASRSRPPLVPRLLFVSATGLQYLTLRSVSLSRPLCAVVKVLAGSLRPQVSLLNPENDTVEKRDSVLSLAFHALGIAALLPLRASLVLKIAP